MASTVENEHPLGVEPGESPRPRNAAPARRPRDPLVTALTYTIISIILLTLVTVIYALLTGVFGTGAPRTMSEKKIMGAQAKIEAGSKEPLDWMTYILALTDDGQYGKAQEFIDKGKKQLKDQDISADMLYMQADLYLAQGKDKEALKTADVALKTIKDRYEEGLAENKKTKKLDKASAFGISENYWELQLLKAEIYEKKQDWDSALKAYDAYLAENKTAATVFAQRANVKEKLGDTKGAEADFRQTLVFIPDNEDALAGLKRIGVAK